MKNRTGCIFRAQANGIARFLIALAFSFIASFNLSAQGVAGIQGTVTDEQGGKVTGADVVLRSRSGLQLSTTTDRTGSFEFRNLTTGSYLIEVKAPGFSVFTSDE